MKSSNKSSIQNPVRVANSATVTESAPLPAPQQANNLTANIDLRADSFNQSVLSTVFFILGILLLICIAH